jgi:diaminohydroxyphosphoribosylaminopyrimidine deaminase/5-amino-6-(5-phosphoribosylamino)uracil reductase
MKNFMLRSIEIAQKARNPSPNPKVGAVIVRDGKIVAEGFHEAAGRPHAEVIAIRKAGKKAADATLYVTLEPCNHHGKTPPCTKAILKAGIKKVVIGMNDPSPWGRGGAAFLKKSGIKVEFSKTKIEQQCRDLNQIWLKNVEKKLPYVTLKVALDEKGSMIPEPGKKWITGPNARREVMKIRAQHDAILVGVNTVLVDNPRLTIRGIKAKKQPTRIILDPRDQLSPTARIFSEPGENLIIRRIPSVLNVLKQAWQKDITSILVEGGPYTAQKFLEASLVDHLMIFHHKVKRKPAKLFNKKLPTRNWELRAFNKDSLFETFLKKY